MSKKSKKIKALLRDEEVLRLAKISQINAYCSFTTFPLLLSLVLMALAHLTNYELNTRMVYIVIMSSLVIRGIGDIVMFFMIRKDYQNYKQSGTMIVDENITQYIVGCHSVIRTRAFTTIFEILMFTFYFKMNIGFTDVLSVLIITYIATMFFVGEKEYCTYKYINSCLKYTFMHEEDEH